MDFNLENVIFLGQKVENMIAFMLFKDPDFLTFFCKNIMLILK